MKASDTPCKTWRWITDMKQASKSTKKWLRKKLNQYFFFFAMTASASGFEPRWKVEV